MTKLSCGPLWKENNKWENVGLCYILSTTSPRSLLGVTGGEVTGGLRGTRNPTLWGSGQRHGKFWFWTLC